MIPTGQLLRLFAASLFIFLLLPLTSRANVGRPDSPDPPPPYRVGNIDSETESDWEIWPLFRLYTNDDAKEVSIVPFLFSWRSDESRFEKLKKGTESETEAIPREKTTHLIWPFIRTRHRDRHWTSNERSEFSFWPLYHQVSENDLKYGKIWHRYFFPLYFQGSQPQNTGKYLILFPFFWYAENAYLVAPFFPKRPQTFAAVWPVMGRFQNWWNRDDITFLFWPLFIKMAEGGEAAQNNHKRLKTGSDEEDRARIYAAPWPFLGLYTGKSINGFYVWPLFSRVNKPGVYTRAYWLWPLGHYRSENLPAEEWNYSPSRSVDGDGVSNGEQKTRPAWLFWFLPFYGKASTPLYDHRMYFPFFGEMDSSGRRTRGYFFSLYSTDENFREGIKTHRLFWFLMKWTSKVPVKEEFADLPPREQPERSGIYGLWKSTKTETRTRFWAFFTLYRFIEDRSDSVTWSRRYVLPFYGRQTKTYREGEAEPLFDKWFKQKGDGVEEEPSEPVKMVSEYIFPFYRKVAFNEDHQYYSAPHFFFYTSFDDIDRNIGSFWEVWRKERNPVSGSYSESVFGSLYRHGKDGDGTSTTQINPGLFKVKWSRGKNGTRKGETSLLFGILKYKWNKPGTP